MRIHLASGDLQARARLGAAAERLGAEWSAGAAVGFSERLEGIDLLVLDLDAGGDEALNEITRMEEKPGRIVGFYSHIDAALGAEAEAAGLHAIRRGRFWRSIDEVLRG